VARRGCRAGLHESHRLGVSSGREAKQSMISTLIQREQEHIEWLDALERSVRDGASFTMTRDPTQCAFGQWSTTFHTRDAVLSEIMEQFDEPHRQIHSLADELIAMTLRGRRDEALERLELERDTTFRRLRTLFSEARDQIEEMSPPMPLFLTDNGQTPRVGLRIEEIDDVVSFSASVFVPADRVSVDVNPGIRQMLLGYMNEGGRQAILIQPTIVFGAASS
ncbi:MAG: CZB domain-containing protein, partial [Myxococcota bacterium]